MARFKNPFAHLGNKSVRAAVRKQKPKKKLKDPYEINIYRKTPKRGVEATVHSIDLHNKKMIPIRAARKKKMEDEKERKKAEAARKRNVRKENFERHEKEVLQNKGKYGNNKALDEVIASIEAQKQEILNSVKDPEERAKMAHQDLVNQKMNEQVAAAAASYANLPKQITPNVLIPRRKNNSSALATTTTRVPTPAHILARFAETAAKLRR